VSPETTREMLSGTVVAHYGAPHPSSGEGHYGGLLGRMISFRV
jgi:hypothetical protein